MSNPKILHDNRLDDGTPAASSTAAGDYDVLNLREWRPYKWWKPASMPATVTVDCGSAVTADYALVWGHDLYTQGCTIEVRGSTDNFSASDVLVASLTPGNDDPFVIAFGSASYRYWRFRFTTGTAPTLAIAAIGAALAIPSSLEDGFDPTMGELHGESNTSEEGNPLGNVYLYNSWADEFRFAWLTWSWIRSTWRPAWEAHLRSKPFAFQWDPAGHPAELFLLNPVTKYRTPHVSGSFASLEFRAQGLAA